MNILAWIIVGLIAGFLARLAVRGTAPGRGIWGDLIAGMIGAIIGGAIFRILGMRGVTGINLGSIIVAFIGAVIFLVIWRAMSGRCGARPV